MKPSSPSVSAHRLTRSPTLSFAHRALVVDEDALVRNEVRLQLGLVGLAVEDIADGREALRRVRSTRFDVLLLGITSPGLDGLSLCRAIRQSGPNTDTPIVLLSPTDSEAMHVRGLRSGADDCLAKPLRVQELQARVTSLMRRHRRERAGDHEWSATVRIELGPQLQLDVTMRRIVAGGRTVALTRREFEVLHHLTLRRNTIVARDTLVRSVWGDDAQVSLRTVDLIVSRLRRKIEADPRCPRVLLTAWGVGYIVTLAE